MYRFDNDPMNGCRRNRGQRVCAVLCFIAAASFLAPATYGVVIDSIVAVVDREVILQSDLLGEAQGALNELRSTATSEADYNRQAERLLRDLLEQQIEAKLLKRQAQLVGESVSDEDVDANIAQLRGEVSYEEFLAELQREGITMSELREFQRQMILASRVRRAKTREFEREVVISEDDVLTYYEAKRDDFERPEEILVSQIQLQAGNDPKERARARARLQSLRRELEAGADFAELARLHSEDLFAEKGGSMGWVERGLLQPELEEAAFALPVGGISQIIDTRVGVHLLRVDDRREAGLRTVDQVRGEIAAELRARLAAEKYERWLDDLRKRSRVRVFY